MRSIKPIFISTLIAIALSSCNSAIAPIMSTNPANIDKQPLKTSPIKETDLQRWSHLDLAKDTIPGMSVDKAYAQLLKGKKGTTVIVGVIDSGVDIDHEDLKGKIWTNKKEIAGNKIDDDKNGYVDDVHGWNFLGEATDENLELTRIVKKGDDGSETYRRAKAELDSKLAEMMQQKPQVDMIDKADKDIKKYLKKEIYTIEDLKKISTTDAELTKSKTIMTSIATQAGVGFQDEIKSYVDYIYGQVNYNLNVNFSGRKTGDNPENMDSKFYGNGNVKGPDVADAEHGTHVSGIIACRPPGSWAWPRMPVDSGRISCSAIGMARHACRNSPPSRGIFSPRAAIACAATIRSRASSWCVSTVSRRRDATPCRSRSIANSISMRTRASPMTASRARATISRR